LRGKIKVPSERTAIQGFVGESGKLEEFDSDGQGLSTIGKAGIPDLAASARIPDWGLLFGRCASGTTRRGMSISGFGEAEATAQRVRDESREEDHQAVFQEAHVYTIKDPATGIPFKIETIFFLRPPFKSDGQEVVSRLR
jgi:hypothetical protein